LLDKQRIPDSLAVLEPAPGLTATQALERMRGLSQALGLPFRRGTLSSSSTADSNVFRLRVDRHRFAVYQASGAIQYRHPDLYRLGPDAAQAGLPSQDSLLARADRDLAKLATVGLIDSSAIDRENVHITHQMTQSAERAKGRVTVGKPVVLDNRIDFARRIGPLRVAGNGVRLTYGNDLRLLGVDLTWRSLRQGDHQRPVAVSREEAIRLFRERVGVHVQLGSTVDLLQAELVYADPGPRKRLPRFVPAYVFLYRVRSPAEGKNDVFVVGKKRLLTLAAVMQGWVPKK